MIKINADKKGIDNLHVATFLSELLFLSTMGLYFERLIMIWF
jgi:hypothetical protein